MSVEQGDVIKSTSTKQQAEAKLREQDILNTPEAQRMLSEMVSKELERREQNPKVQQPALDVSSIVEAVVRGTSHAADSGVVARQKGIQGDIPYIAKDDDLLEDPVSYKCNMVAYLLWPCTTNGKLHNSPNGGAAEFRYAGMRREGDQAVVESYYHTFDKNWCKFIEGHSEFGSVISKVGANSSTKAGTEIAIMMKWVNLYGRKMHSELDREINVINGSLPEDQHIPKGDIQTMRNNLAGYRSQVEMEANSKIMLNAQAAKDAAFTSVPVEA